ncbi:hypothetical protein HpHA233_11920 [Helicobacter pylori]
MSKSKKELFLELAQPDKNGMSRWVSAIEFIGKYQGLQLGNGGSWCRSNSSLAKEFELEFDKGQTLGNSIDRIRLNGYNTRCVFNQRKITIANNITRCAVRVATLKTLK